MLELAQMNTEVLFQLFLAAMIGAFIGLEREVTRSGMVEDEDSDSFGGLRSYALLSTIGALSLWLDIVFGSFIFTLLGFFAVVSFILVSHIYAVFKKDNIGITSEYSAILTYLLGVLVMMGNTKMAVIITIGLVIILSSKEFFEKIKTKISKEELSNTLKFAVVSFVILPLLPDQKYSFAMLAESVGFGGSTDIQNAIWNLAFFNPYSVWFFVVAISAIGYLGYILSKLMGKNNSIIYSGLLGGLVSSTAVTATMSEQSKKDPANSNIYVVGTLSANLVMMARVLVIVAFFNFALLQTFTLPFIFMFGGLLSAGVFYYYQGLKSKKVVKKIESKIESPFSIIPALKFGGFVLFIKFLAGVGILYKDVFGEGMYYYVLGIISGFADVDAITQTMATGSQGGTIVASVATSTIILAVMSNNMVKGTIAYRFGESVFGKKIFISFLVSIVAGVVGIILGSLYFS